ncbi:MAG: SH3 domain-containing protein, partial [Bacteroidales bacterium]
KLIEKEGYASSELFYNMGNAYYKQGQNGKAILYYEKAFKLDPSNGDIETNLEIAKLNTLDKIDTLPEFILSTWIKEFRNMMSSNKWGYTSIVFLAIMALLLIGYNFAPTTRQRKLAFVLACVSLLFAIFSILFAANLRSNANNSDFAIVMVPVSNVKSAPNSTGNNLFILHVGAKIEILEQVEGWCKIELSDGRQGWIHATEMEVI